MDRSMAKRSEEEGKMMAWRMSETAIVAWEIMAMSDHCPAGVVDPRLTTLSLWHRVQPVGGFPGLRA